jgi:Flp pilus assembly secretin CpaC
MSGAGTAAYRLGRLVNAPEYTMSMNPTRARARAAALARSLAVGVLLYPAAALAGTTGDVIAVNVDQARLIKLPERIATIVVGNPLIADVSMQPGGIIVVTGKGYGATNVIAMDRKGEILVDRVIQVEGPTDQLVTIYRGADRESYSCMPICQRRVTLGDAEGFFKATMDQAGSLNSQATGAATAKQN